jgi:hypothetical protein
MLEIEEIKPADASGLFHFRQASMAEMECAQVPLFG